MESIEVQPPPMRDRTHDPVRTAHRAPVVAPPPRPAGGDHGHAGSNGHDDWGQVTELRSGKVVMVTVLMFLALGALFATGFIPRVHNTAELNADAAAALNGPIPVATIQPKVAPSSVELLLPGNLRPWQEVSIYARSTGYLKKWYADISNHVKQGDLMAEIDSPEVDQQLLQGQAAVLQMKAAQAQAASGLQMAQITNTRYQSLKGTSGVTQQDLDQKAADLSAAEAGVEAAKANVAAAESNVKRLLDLQSYQKVTAPFDGVITGRSFDTGALINADPTSADIKPMYKIAENDILRVFVNVPQSSALTIQKGMEVKVTARERPGRVFIGKVMGTTNYLDPSSRSLLTEIKVPNDDGALLPGMFVQAGFTVTRDKPPLIIPSPALIVNAEGTQVAIVLKDNTIHFQKVKLGEDYGNTLEITGGLEGNEQIISTPGEKIIEGALVKVISSEAGNQKPAQQKTDKLAEGSR